MDWLSNVFLVFRTLFSNFVTIYNTMQLTQRILKQIIREVFGEEKPTRQNGRDVLYGELDTLLEDWPEFEESVGALEEDEIFYEEELEEDLF